ncbi:hypothetical protein GCM10029978_045240 [Actinoallomurus acanthiterrae]
MGECRIMGDYRHFSALVVAFIVRHYFSASLLDFTSVMSDEIDCWHQVATFRTVGFAGGVYGVDEPHAELPFIHFGTNGPAYPMLLAGIGSIAGWRPFSGPVINMAAVKLFLWHGASAWENTILVDRANFGPGLVNVPAGLGLTLHLRENDQTVRSRYLLVTEATALKLRPDRLRLLTTTDQGNLYIRKD